MLINCRWPTVHAENIAHQYMQYANFPKVARFVDGVLFKIDAPIENESHYVDRKGNHSINAMMVAGPDLTFYYVSAK